MKRLLCSLGLVGLLVCTGCNYKMLDTNWDFNYAYITCPNGEIIEVAVAQWTEDDNSITIQAEDGQVYSVGYQNCWLTKEKMEW